MRIIVYSILLLSLIVLIVVIAAVFITIVCVIFQRNKAIGPGPIQDTRLVILLFLQQWQYIGPYDLNSCLV